MGGCSSAPENNKDFNRKYPAIIEGLGALPDETVVDGEIVALDDSGQPSFNLLQNYGTSDVPICYYVFDLLVLSGRDLMSEPLAQRRDLLRSQALPKLKDPVRESPELNASLSDVIRAARAQGLGGVAKNLNSPYEPSRRSGAWQKMRVNKGQEFVMGGYTAGPRSFDAVILGLLRSWETSVRWQDSQWLYSDSQGPTPQRVSSPWELRMPVCEPSRTEIGAMGVGPCSGKDEGLPMAEARVSRSI